MISISLLAQPAPPVRKQVDLHSALALSQAQLYGTTGVTARADRAKPVADVLILIAEAHWANVRARLATHGATIRFEDAKSGYVRATVSLADVRQLFEWPEIDATRVDGLAGFNTMLQPQSLRTSLGFPEADVLVREPTNVPAPSPASSPTRPVLTVEIARRYPINTDQDMAVREFRAQHPTFDGRGVGIGILESTWLPIDQPAYAEARALDGTLRRKVLRYLDVPSTRAEVTSAPFSEWFDCLSGICNVNERVIRLPGAGRYRIADFRFTSPSPADCRGMMFSVLQREEGGRLYVDRNRDFDFLDEPPLADFNTPAWDARSIVELKCGGHRPLRTVATIDADSRFARLHPFYGRHVAMTSSVAAGSEVEGNLAVGVAPNASLVVIDAGPSASLISQYLEGAITLARDPDVDLLFAALQIHTPLGTAASFDARALDRISEGYNKPILISAGNHMTALAVSPAASAGLTMTVGQYISSATTQALAGITRPEVAVVGSTVGPAWDGATRPDFVAASRRPAAYPCVQGAGINLTNQFELPACYSLSGGTSAAGPSAAGVVALLLSAAKQRGLTPSVADIREALIDTARLMSGLPTHTQGAGLINVSRAWQYLQRRSTPASLDIEGDLRHAFVDLLGSAKPKGLFWMARSGEPQALTVTLRVPPGRETGRLSVRSQGDLSVSFEQSVVDARATPRVPVTIVPPPLGRVASSWVTFSDSSGFTVARALATAARPAPLSMPTYSYAWKEDVDIETHRGTVVAVPSGTTGMLVEIDRLRGDHAVMFSNPAGLILMPRTYWSGAAPFTSPVMHEPGHYAGVLMDPAEGDWGVANIEHSTLRVGFPNPPERLSVGVRLTAFRTLCSLVDRTPQGSLQRLRVAVNDAFAKPANGGVWVAPARGQSERFTLRDEFERRPITIDVKPGTAAFHVLAAKQGSDAIMLQLFDCTQGHCIPVIQTVPGEPSPALNVRQPRSGIWQVFAVPIRHTDKATNVEVTVTQALEVNLSKFAPVVEKAGQSNGGVFEGDVPAVEGGSGYLLLRTDERAQVNKEGWGAISVCAIQPAPQSR